MNSDVPMNQLASDWEEALLLYPLYVAMGREFVVEVPVCVELEAPPDTPDQEAVEKACEWLALMDGRIPIHQLRQFLQTTPLADEHAVRAVLMRHLRKPFKTPMDRDKVDFLLVQYFSLRAPSRLEDADLDFAYVTQVLEPALGAVDAVSLPWMQTLDEVLNGAGACTSLSGLLDGEILERGRKVKADAEDEYFTPAAMVTFTRFSFLMRRAFFRLMHQDLNAILDGLRELERHGIYALDCRKAQFAQEEPTSRLRMVCQSWKVMFHAEYSSGQPLRMLADLRSAVELALSRTEPRQNAAGAEGD